MLKDICIPLLVLYSFAGRAQQTEKITVKAGEDLSAVLSIHGLYKFPAFNLGTVLFKDQTTTRAKMNFNVFLNEMQFIDNKGDTLVINNPELIDSITLDSGVFFYEKGYRQVIAAYNSIKLVVEQKISYETVKNGAFGLPSPGASIEAYGRSTSTTSINELALNEDIVVKRETSYFLTYKKYRSTRANHSGFFTVFPGIKKEIDDFIEANKINFAQEVDLKKLTGFCAQHS
jgi:hypothetical protein